MTGDSDMTPDDTSRWSFTGAGNGGSVNASGTGTANGGSVLARAGVKENRFIESRTTFLADGAKLKGVFEFSGRTEINCELEGELVVTGDLIIGPDAEIRANVFADSVTIHGTVYGDIKAEQLVDASHTAVILGNILSPKLNFKEGSYFRGRCWMSEEAVRGGKMGAKAMGRGTAETGTMVIDG